MYTRLLAILLILGSFSLIPTGSYWRTGASSTENIFTAIVSVSPPSPTPVASPVPSIPPETDHIVISEVQISTAASSSSDFIELYNPTSMPYDLIGHRIVRRGATSSTDTTIKSWNTQTIIQPHGYYLWATSDNSYHMVTGADTSTSENIAANNSVALRLGAENTGLIIDALSWNSHTQSLKEGSEFASQPGADQSIERKAYISSSAETMSQEGTDAMKGNAHDSNNNAQDFVLQTRSQPQNSQSPPEQP